MFPSLLKSKILKRKRTQIGVCYNDAQGPDNITVVAIGDIHGQDAQLHTLLDRLKKMPICASSSTIYIFLGDYIDRGPSSQGVVDQLIEWGKIYRTIFLSGNHEYFLLKFLEDPISNIEWLNYGGLETLISYKVPVKNGHKTDREIIEIRDKLSKTLPDSHKAFLKNLKYWHIEGDFLFVHAGLKPNVPIADNSHKDLLWIREPFLSHPHPYEKVVVHGHTLTPNNKPEIRANRVCLEAGSYTNGILTALVIKGKDKQFVSN